jgi:hypothetical protein
MTAERDVIKGELDQAWRDLDVGRAKARDVASQLARMGQDLVDDGKPVVARAADDGKPVTPRASDDDKPVVARTVTDRQVPPPLPPPRAAAVAKPEPAEVIFEVTEDPKPAASRMRTGLLLVAGVLVGCAATFAIMNSRSSNAAGYSHEQAALPSSAVAAPLATEPAPQAMPAPTAPRMGVEPSADPSTGTEQPPPASDLGTSPGTAGATAAVAAPTASTTEGTIVLPPEAAGHRVFVDGRVIEVKGSRAMVPCGARELRIGSQGPAQKLDVACGGETAVPPVSTD